MVGGGRFSQVTLRVPAGAAPFCLQDLEIGQVTAAR